MRGTLREGGKDTGAIESEEERRSGEVELGAWESEEAEATSAIKSKKRKAGSTRRAATKEQAKVSMRRDN